MKRKLILILRKLGLMGLADRVRYSYHYAKTRSERKLFVKKHETVKLPPPYFIYETFRLNYDSYYYGGKETASSLIEEFNNYKLLSNVNVLDWGCGPGRIVRHFPELLPDCNIFGTDYNHQYIDWCKRNLKSITFKRNDLSPPLDFDSNYFDFIFGISIFTHLSEKMHYEWVAEFKRVLKPGGVLYVSMHGLSFRRKLSEEDKSLFDQGKLVFSKKTKEGHRTFVAFHPEKFVRELFVDFEVLEHISGGSKDGPISQDIWVVKKV